MNPLEQHIQRINEKLQQLLKQHQMLQKENETLKSSLQELKSKQQANALLIDELEQKVSILKTATHTLSSEDKKVLEKRINHYVKAIDKCISMLSE